MQIQEKNCLHCQGTFIPKRADARYCSPSCKQLSYLNRKNETDIMDNEAVKEPDEEEILPIIPENESNEQVTVKLPVKTSVKPDGFTANVLSVKNSLPAKNKEKFGFRNGISVKNNTPKIPPILETRQTETTATKVEIKEPDYMEEKEAEWLEKKEDGTDMASLIKRWGYNYLGYVTKTNEQLRKWLKMMVGFNNRNIRVKVMKEFLTSIKEYQQSNDYKYLPTAYPYFGYVEELKSKLQKIIIHAEITRNDSMEILLTDKSKAEITYILMDIDL